MNDPLCYRAGTDCAGFAHSLAVAGPAWQGLMALVPGTAPSGLGLAALASHLGFGEELANFMMIALLAVVAMVAIGWIMRRMRGAQPAGPQLAGAGAPFPASAGAQAASGSTMAHVAGCPSTNPRLVTISETNTPPPKLRHTDR